ncbi:MAG: hypothetical protein GPJ54_12200 [Candidatus Heimdallarchaeota archaeon]|nr:hypothetical protein [Candidatus Heimdallarchaeota archaeon]
MSVETKSKIARLKSQAKDISEIVSMISKEKLAEPTKEGGWSINQIVHHIADAHLHAYMRVKWIYTEDMTILKTFDQDTWVNAPDTDNISITGSLTLLSGICERWGKFSENLSEEDWQKLGIHPEAGEISIEAIFNFFVDHGEAHIDQLKKFL